MYKIFIFLLFLFLISNSSISQNLTDTSNIFSGTVRIAAGKEYEAGWLHKIFLGAHWRDLWTTPVEVGILDLNTFAGGLTPTNRGGGLQTKSLKFQGNDGSEYKFRSLNKDPRKALEKVIPGFGESIAADVVKDQISSSNPYAPFVVAPLLNVVGVFQNPPLLVVLPDDEKLGEFRKDFGREMGILEKAPGEQEFEGSDKIVSSVKLFNRLDKNFDESVDAKEFLKARLMDIFFGDWDRHKDQWKWIRFEYGDKKVYKPFPMDRDQAFSEFDGVLPLIGESILPQLNHFGSNYTGVKFITWAGRYLDQRILPFLTKYEWDSVTDYVYSKLTDTEIEYSVKQLPLAIYRKAKDELLEKLKSRRDQLKEISYDYYELVNSVVDVYTTNKRDFIEINLLRDAKTDISVYKRDKETGEKEGEPLRHKTFDNDMTCEFRIYLQDGDDKVVIDGKDNSTPLIRIIGGDGQDELVDNSDAKVIFYDDGKKTKIKEGEHTSLNTDKYKEPKDSLEKYLDKNKDKLSKEKKDELEEQLGNLRYDPLVIDRGHLWAGFPLFTYNPDVGPFLGGGVILYEYGFRTLPYVYKMQLTAGYAPEKKGLPGLLVDYKGFFYGLIKNTLVNFHLRKSGIEVNNYYGQGNETTNIDSLEKAGYYKVEHEEYLFNPSVDFPSNKKFKILFGTVIKYFEVNQKDNTLINSSQPYGVGKLSLLGIQAGFRVDGRDHPLAPYSGYYFDITGTYYPKVFNNQYRFGKVSADLRSYLYAKSFTDISLTLRVKGEKLWGTYPFYEFAFIGGSKTVRGFASERFAGDGSLLGSAELRFKLFKMFFLFPETLGMFVFGESGRVFLEGEDSKKWHTGYGGGLYMFVVNRDIALSLAYARSVEKKYAVYFSAGFSF